MHIPFIDLKSQYESIKLDIDSAIDNAIHRFQFLKGEEILQFESEFASLLGVKKIIATASGTSSLFIVLKALGIRPRDEVITPAVSWIASADTISLCGAIPVFVDIDYHYNTLDINQVKRRINPKTKAVIAVHLYGQAAPVVELRTLCDFHGIALIEDCAQGHLTKDNGYIAGSVGHAAAFSFYPTKSLGAYGDAGCVATNDIDLAEKVMAWTNHGSSDKGDHATQGTNSRMDTLQAAILMAKLPHLQRWIERKNEIARLYTQGLADIQQVVSPRERSGSTHSYHIYAVRAQLRDELKEFLKANGIETLVHYPKALTNLAAFSELNLKQEDFPVANSHEKEILSLPMYPELNDAQVKYICEKIRLFYNQRFVSSHIKS